MHIKKIMSQEEKAKRDKIRSMVIGIALTAILLFSTAGYAFFSGNTEKQQKIEYKGIKFVLGNDNLWHTTIQDYEFALSFNPKETENISGFLSLNIQNYISQPLYFTYDSNKQAINEISSNIERFTSRIQYVCLDNCTEDFPIKNCSSNIISIKQENETLIKQEDSCVFIHYKDNAVRAADAFIFKILGI